MPTKPIFQSPAGVGRFRVLALLVALVVFLQAVLAGQFLNASTGAMGPHRLIGEGLGLLVVALAAEGYRVRARHAERSWLGWTLLVFVIAQTGLGFGGRNSATAAALHVPLGVAMFGVALVAAMPKVRA